MIENEPPQETEPNNSTASVSPNLSGCRALQETISRRTNASANSSPSTELVLSNLELQDEHFSAAAETTTKEEVEEEEEEEEVRLPPSLQRLDLSRNRLTIIPRAVVLDLSALTHLDMSRNSLKGIPPEIQNLSQLREIKALSNNIRLRQLPLPELASLVHLRLLDLRYNKKLKQAALNTLQESLITAPSNHMLEIRCTVPNNNSEKNHETSTTKKLSACDRDATLLRSQLEPLSTPHLKKRLQRTFGVAIDDEHHDEQKAFDREYIMRKLLDCYERHGPRTVRQERGIPVRQERLDALLFELQNNISWPHTTRERPKIRAQHYMILQRPGTGQPDSVRTKREMAKLTKYQRIFDLAVETIQEVDYSFSQRFTALAVTKNFIGSPHIDTLNVAPFYGLALGDFGDEDGGGGKIAVECCPLTVAEVDTRGRLAKVDGRFPHWVMPYNNDRDRYSLIYYVTSGKVEPQTTAIFEPPRELMDDDDDDDDDGQIKEWIPPPIYIK